MLELAQAGQARGKTKGATGLGTGRGFIWTGYTFEIHWCIPYYIQSTVNLGYVLKLIPMGLNSAYKHDQTHAGLCAQSLTWTADAPWDNRHLRGCPSGSAAPWGALSPLRPGASLQTSARLSLLECLTYITYSFSLSFRKNKQEAKPLHRFWVQHPRCTESGTRSLLGCSVVWRGGFFSQIFKLRR